MEEKTVSQSGFIDYNLSFGARLVDAVMAEGFYPTSLMVQHDPQYYREHYRGYLDILSEAPAMKRRLFIGPLYQANLPQRLATIHTLGRGASQEHWVVDVRGRQTIPVVEAFLAKVLPRFGATATVELISEDNRYKPSPFRYGG